MEPTSKERRHSDIRAAAYKYKDIIPKLLAAHALSGCDTVAQCYGIGKTSVVKVLQADHRSHNIDCIGDVNANIQDILSSATSFISKCYGISGLTTMTDVRCKAWKIKTSRASIVSSPKLNSLPPTTEAFEQNVRRAHFQACTWLNSIEPNPPILDPVQFGWMKDRNSGTLKPVMLPSNVSQAPDYILKLIKCACVDCKSMKCSCVLASLPCTIFCTCEGDINCCNPHTETVKQFSDEDDQTILDEDD